jgi:hypothetical protein
MAHDEQAYMGRPGLNHIFKGVTESVLVASPPPLPQPKMHRRLASMELTHRSVRQVATRSVIPVSQRVTNRLIW